MKKCHISYLMLGSVSLLSSGHTLSQTNLGESFPALEKIVGVAQQVQPMVNSVDTTIATFKAEIPQMKADAQALADEMKMLMRDTKDPRVVATKLFDIIDKIPLFIDHIATLFDGVSGIAQTSGNIIGVFNQDTGSKVTNVVDQSALIRELITDINGIFRTDLLPTTRQFTLSMLDGIEQLRADGQSVAQEFSSSIQDIKNQL